MQEVTKLGIKVDSLVKPYTARSSHGWGTQFSVPQYHKGDNDRPVLDGYISVVANGEYPFEKGDQIKIIKIKNVFLKKGKNGEMYYTVFADVELVKETYRVKKGQRDIKKVIDDIPEELL